MYSVKILTISRLKYIICQCSAGQSHMGLQDVIKTHLLFLVFDKYRNEIDAFNKLRHELMYF